MTSSNIDPTLTLLLRRYEARWNPVSVWADPTEAHKYANELNLGEQNLDWRLVRVPAKGLLLELIHVHRS